MSEVKPSGVWKLIRVRKDTVCRRCGTAIPKDAESVRRRRTYNSVPTVHYCLNCYEEMWI